MEIKTIETMAREYATVKRSDDTPDTEGIDLQRADDFRAGAYAVLDEISQSVFTGNWAAFPIRNIEALRKKIILLKSEITTKHDEQD